MAVLVERDQAVGRGNTEQNGGSGNKQPDAQVTGKHRDEEPVAKIGDQVALVPPRPAWIARPEISQHGEDTGKRQRDRDALDKSLADIDDESEQFLTHNPPAAF